MSDMTQRVGEIVADHSGLEGPLLPILHAVQAEWGHVPAAVVPVIAEALNLTRAEVHGVVSFYHDFREIPAGRQVLKLCRAEACQAQGGAGIAELAQDRLGIGWHETTPDGAITLEPVYCLGLCACGPAAMVGGSAGRQARPRQARPDHRRVPGMRIFVPRDAAAKALGAEDVVEAIRAEAARRGLPVQIVRNGSRGMVWLEPLVEVEREGVRHAFGPAAPEDAAAILDGTGGKALGPTDELPWMRGQTRLTFARVGVIDPLSLADYEAHGGLAGLRHAIDIGAADVVDEIIESGLRGRGGAGFPTGIKWKTVHDAAAPQKYVVCNADEGDSGTFADRMLIEGDPFCLIEGMAIAGIAVGATKGYVYLRSEYPDAIEVMGEAVRLARAGDLLGPSVLGSGHAFDLEMRVGAGAYVCGEETSLLNSLEGRRGRSGPSRRCPRSRGFSAGRPSSTT